MPTLQSANDYNLAIAERERRKRRKAAPATIPAPAEFIPTLTIEEPQGQDTAIIPFALWPAQVNALEIIGQAMRLIILKARQLGITWLVLAWAYWLCIFHPGRTVLFFSKGQLEADELIRRGAGMHARYPGQKPAITKENTSELVWANGSRWRSLPATASAGRSFTASVIIFDEYAWMVYAQAVYSAAKPTVDNGGKMIILSSANGEGDPFEVTWQGAVKGENGFTPLFLPWTARPDRTPAWYAAVASAAFSMAEMKREYPATPDEAFSEVTAERFIEHMAIWDACYEALPPLTDREPLVWAADAGVSNDTFALVGVTRHPVRRDDIAVRVVMQWTPQRGAELDFIAIGQEIITALRRWYSIVFVFDSFQMHLMAQQIEAAGFWVEKFGQQQPRLVADKQLRDLILARRIAHDGDATLRAAIDNADREIGGKDHNTLRIVKRSEAKKIDPAVALSMAAAKCLELNL